MRPIDADAMRTDWLEHGENEYVYDTNAVLESIDDQPTIDAEPVRHGEWGETQIIGYDGIHPVYAKPCSECGHLTDMYRPRYCPNCGAKMDGGKKDG